MSEYLNSNRNYAQREHTFKKYTWSVCIGWLVIGRQLKKIFKKYITPSKITLILKKGIQWNKEWEKLFFKKNVNITLLVHFLFLWK